MFTLVKDREREQDQLFSIVPVPLPELPLALIQCSVNKLWLFHVQWNVSESWFDKGFGLIVYLPQWIESTACYR